MTTTDNFPRSSTTENGKKFAIPKMVIVSNHSEIIANNQ
jgi:hypothetical protein